MVSLLGALVLIGVTWFDLNWRISGGGVNKKHYCNLGIIHICEQNLISGLVSISILPGVEYAPANPLIYILSVDIRTCPLKSWSNLNKTDIHTLVVTQQMCTACVLCEIHKFGTLICQQVPGINFSVFCIIRREWIPCQWSSVEGDIWFTHCSLAGFLNPGNMVWVVGLILDNIRLRLWGGVLEESQVQTWAKISSLDLKPWLKT